MRTPSPDKVAFVLSVAVFAFVYGIATQAFGWPPSSLVQRAWNQAEAISPLSTDRFSAGDGADGDSPGWLTSRVYDRSGVRIQDPNAVEPGLTLISTWWEDLGWTQGLKLIDRDGKTVHQWKIDGSDVFPDRPDEHVRRDPARMSIHGAHLLPDGDVLVNIEYVGTARIDACGETVWRLPVGSHHSIHTADDGSFWISAGAYGGPATSTDDSARYGGLRPTYQDLMVRVSPDGSARDEFRVLDVLFRNDLEDHIPATSWHTPSEIDTNDVTHLNDVEPLPRSMAAEYPRFQAGDLLVSLNHLDLVFVFDPNSGRVKWHVSEPLIGQHDPDFMGDGWIGVFDNRRDGTDQGTLLGGSRILAFQPHTGSMKKLFPTPRSEPFHTDSQGKWQLLDNGNLLLTEAQAGRIVEVGPDGRTVWEWVSRPYSEAEVPEVNSGTRYDLTRENVASWPCSPGGRER